jgi:hypothetical protein
MLWWVLIAWSVIRLLRDDEPRWWVAIGLFAGLGLQTKYSIAFELVGVLVGVLLTDARRYVTSGWFWAGGATALLIFAPNLAGSSGTTSFPTISCKVSTRATSMRDARTASCAISSSSMPTCLRRRSGSRVWSRTSAIARYRMLAWMYVVPLLLFLFAQGRFYYTSARIPCCWPWGP